MLAQVAALLQRTLSAVRLGRGAQGRVPRHHRIVVIIRIWRVDLWRGRSSPSTACAVVRRLRRAHPSRRVCREVRGVRRHLLHRLPQLTSSLRDDCGVVALEDAEPQRERERFMT